MKTWCHRSSYERLHMKSLVRRRDECFSVTLKEAGTAQNCSLWRLDKIKLLEKTKTKKKNTKYQPISHFSLWMDKVCYDTQQVLKYVYSHALIHVDLWSKSCNYYGSLEYSLTFFSILCFSWQIVYVYNMYFKLYMWENRMRVEKVSSVCNNACRFCMFLWIRHRVR